jgi:S-adenosylmethionine:tRNA ribosyltransferase-isomerase
LILLNETRVIHARLIFSKPTGSRIEVFLLEPVYPSDIQLAFHQKDTTTWKCLVGNVKRWKSGPLTLVSADPHNKVELKAEKLKTQGDTFIIKFCWNNGLSFSEMIEQCGNVPLPPYIDREADERDDTCYQTIFAKNEGSVAAPTAGLHFTDQVLTDLRQKQVSIDKITLHVGAGTFRPVVADVLHDHEMHSEQVVIPMSVIENLLAFRDKPITLVGTTTVRAIESLYWQGVKWLMKEPDHPLLDVQQWDPYDLTMLPEFSTEEVLYCLMQVMMRFKITELRGQTSLIIVPGYRYRFPSAIVTNFHQPNSTLLLLVAAFIGPEWKEVYKYALDHGFRFLSYGDSCLFFNAS